MNPSKPASLRLSNRLWLALLVLAFILQVIFPYRGWMILLASMGGAFIIAYLWSRSLAGSLRLSRAVRYGWAQVGDLLEERFDLENRGWWPAVWVEIVDESTLPGEPLSRATGVGGNSHNEWLASRTCTRRGVFNLGPTTIHTGDPFGIFSVTIHDDATATLLVTPAVLPLPSIEVAPGGRSGEGRPGTHAIELSINAASVRDYLPGDSLRWIHWPTLARRDKWSVKTFDHTPTGDWWVILDLDRRVQSGREENSSEEMGVTLAASLAVRGLQSGRSVGLVASGEPFLWLHPEAGEAQRWRVLRALAAIEPGSTPLHLLLKAFSPSLGRQASLVLVTADLKGEWLTELTSLARRGMAPTVLTVENGIGFDSADSAHLRNLLASLGIAHYSITPELFTAVRTSAKTNAWEWRVTPTGRAIPIRQPGDMNWRSLV